MSIKLPFISRRHHVTCIKRMAGYVQALTTENDELRRQIGKLQWLEREELRKRLTLEREVRFRDVRIRGALALSAFDGVRDEK